MTKSTKRTTQYQPGNDRLDLVIRPIQRQALEQAAAHTGETVSQFIRRTLMEAIGKPELAELVRPEGRPPK